MHNSSGMKKRIGRRPHKSPEHVSAVRQAAALVRWRKLDKAARKLATEAARVVLEQRRRGE